MKHNSNTVGKKMEWRSIGVVAGKWTSFSRLETASTRLFSHKSTQVVDFPGMYEASIFLGTGKRILEPPREMESWSFGVLGDEGSRKWWKSMKIFMIIHAFSRFITQIRPVIPRFSRFLGWEPFLRKRRIVGTYSRQNQPLLGEVMRRDSKEWFA